MNRNEFVELLSILSYYLVGGLALGVISATVAVNGGVLLVAENYGLPLPAKVMTAAVIIGIGAMTGILAFLVLLPAELAMMRRKNHGES